MTDKIPVASFQMMFKFIQKETQKQILLIKIRQLFLVLCRSKLILNMQHMQPWEKKKVRKTLERNDSFKNKLYIDSVKFRLLNPGGSVAN